MSTRIIEADYWDQWVNDPWTAFSISDPLDVIILWFIFIIFLLCSCCCCLKLESRFKKKGFGGKHRRGGGGGSMGEDGDWDEDDRGLGAAGAEDDMADNGEAVVFPAYSDGWPVEIFSSQHGQWLQADLHTKLARGSVAVRSQWDPTDDEEVPAEVIYAATLRNANGRTTKASLEVLRTPLQQNEAVEIFMASLKRWVPGEVGKERRTNGIHIQYSIKQAKSEIFKQLPASALRRRFDAGQEVQVYRGSKLGWVDATVAEGPQNGASESIPAKLYWKQVPLKFKGEEAEEGKQSQTFLSCLIRPAGSVRVNPMKNRPGTALFMDSNNAPAKPGTTLGGPEGGTVKDVGAGVGE